MRLGLSVLGAVLVHGAVFAVAAVVLSRAPAAPPVPAPRLDVDVVEVTPPKPDPVAAPSGDPAPALVRAKLVAPAHRPPRRLAPARAVARSDSPAAAAPELSVPAAPAPAAAAVAPGIARGPAAPATGALTAAEPHYRTNPRPDYPLASRRRHEEGVVLLSVTIQADGSPVAVSIKRSSGHPLLDEAALEKVRATWTFEPARVGAVAVPSTRDVPIRFSLSD